MSRDTNALLPLNLREEIKRRKWTPGNLVDLHKMGVHWHDDKFMPVSLDPLTYAAYFRSGLTSPITLPTYFPDDTQDKIKRFLEFNYFKLAHGGAQYLGNEFNIMPEEKFETAKLRVCILRLSTYADIDGAFGHYLISNFVEDYSDDIFVDFAFRPDDSDYSKLMDAQLPLLWANTTKRPLQDFDLIIISNSFPQERINIPILLLKSGIPMYRWERMDKTLPYYDKCPIIVAAGLGASFIESMASDNPVKGVGENSWVELNAIGEGELLDLKLFQHYINVREDGGGKEEFLATIDNEHLSGMYDPTRVLWEYNDKIHQMRDHLGKPVGEPVVWEGGGSIKRVSLIDPDTETLHVLAGAGSEEFEAMEAANVNLLDYLRGPIDLEEMAKKYTRVKRAARPERPAPTKEIQPSLE